MISTSLREKWRNMELFLVRIFPLQSKYGKIQTRNNSVFGHFSRSAFYIYLDYFPKSFYCFDNLIYLTTSEYFIVSMKFTQLSLDFCFKTLNVDNLKIFIKNQHFLEHNCSKVFLTGINIFNCLLEPYQHLKCLRKV